MGKRRKKAVPSLDVLRCPRCLNKTLVVAVEVTEEEEQLEINHPGGIIHYSCLSCWCRVPVCQRCQEYRPDVFFYDAPCSECKANTEKVARLGAGGEDTTIEEIEDLPNTGDYHEPD